MLFGEQIQLSTSMGKFFATVTKANARKRREAKNLNSDRPPHDLQDDTYEVGYTSL